MADLAAAVDALRADREPWQIEHHGEDCCVLAVSWLQGLDATFHRGRARAAAPAWVARRWARGATRPELHWCEIPQAPALSCAAAAAVGRDLWGGRCDGIRAVQLVELLSAHRAATRDREELRAAGPGELLAYHEAVGRERDGSLEIWDCANGVWLRPPAAGRSPTVGVRVAGAPATLRWGDTRVQPGSWCPVAGA